MSGGLICTLNQYGIRINNDKVMNYCVAEKQIVYTKQYEIFSVEKAMYELYFDL